MAHTAPQLEPVLHALSLPGNSTCFYCGEPGTTRDHVQPRSCGGSNTTDNLVSACARCNSLKGSHRLPSEALVLRLVRRHTGREREAVAACGLNPLLELHQAIPGMPELVEELLLLALVRAGGSLNRAELYRAVRAGAPMDEATLDAYLGVLRDHVSVEGERVTLLALSALPERERGLVASLLELLLTWKARKVRREKVRARVAGRLRQLEDPQASAERVLTVLAGAGVLVPSELDRKGRGYFDITARPPDKLLGLAPALARQLFKAPIPVAGGLWVPAYASV